MRTGGIFIHSVAGSTRSVYNLPAGEYLKLGQPASHGCIRTCVADAKWVYENCNGSTIHIYSSGNYVNNESFKGPLAADRWQLSVEPETLILQTRKFRDLYRTVPERNI